MRAPRTFAGAGFSGGFNAVVPMGQGEWRFLGIETALHQEFGDYLHFCRHLGAIGLYLPLRSAPDARQTGKRIPAATSARPAASVLAAMETAG